MDRRKVQIEKKVEEIIEETNLMQANINNIMHHIKSGIDIINTSTKVKQKDCTLFLKYQLEVLKKFTEINYELENILDESPLRQLQAHIFEESRLTNKPTEPKVEVIKKRKLIAEVKQETLNVVEDQEQMELAESLDCSSVVCARENESHGNFSDSEIQGIRDTLRKFSEKYECSQQYISLVTDVYQKSTINDSVEFYDNCSTSLTPKYPIGCSNIDLERGIGDGFEVPEKDTNIAITQNGVDALPKVESTTDDKDFVNSTPFPTADKLHLVEEFEKTEPEKICSIDDNSSTYVSADTTESSSNDEYVTDKVPPCLMPLRDEHSSIMDNIINKDYLKTENNATSTIIKSYTALEKLNNMKIFDREEEEIDKLQVIDKPDILLRPTEHRIKNNFDSERKSKKQKKKKNKNKENEFYELVPKAPPKKGSFCAFSHVESPNEFYIHLVDDDSTQIDCITDQLNAKFKGTMTDYNSKEEALSGIGNFCFAYVISYNSWYRAQVLNWDLDSKSEDVLVQFVDYGNKRRVSYKNLRAMTKEMTEIPMLAVQCHLALMYPPNSTHDNKLTEWPSATIDAMMELSGLMGNNEWQKIFRIVFANQEENSISIDMCNLQEEEENTVGQILLNLGLAEQIIENFSDTQGHEEHEDHAELEEFLQDLDSLEQADNINEAVMGYDPRDEMRICRFTKSDGSCFKGKNCKLEHVPLSKDGFTTDKMLVFNEAMYSLPLPACGAFVNILITGYKDVCNFFAQIIWKPRKEKGYMIDGDLYSLLADMNQERNVRTFETFKMPPALGEIVIVKHISNKFLRAKVREQIAGKDDRSTKYQVFTVDFGEYLSVPLTDLRKIKPHFLELPFQAVECYLHNYEARKDCDKKKPDNFFFGNLYYRNFVAEVMSTSLPLRTAVTTFDRRDIGKLLAKEGYAKERVCDKNPAEGYLLELY